MRSDKCRSKLPVLNMPSWKKFAQRTRVPFGTVLGILFLLSMHPSVRLMHPSRQSLWIGGAIALCGALLRIWAAGHIEKGRVLTQGGPYAFTRNPLYLALLAYRLSSEGIEQLTAYLRLRKSAAQIVQDTVGIKAEIESLANALSRSPKKGFVLIRVMRIKRSLLIPSSYLRGCNL